MVALVIANMCLYEEMANLSFYRSVDFCSCEVTMTIDNQLQLRNNDLS